MLLQRFIDEVDPQAFLMVTKRSEVVGKGFMSYIRCDRSGLYADRR